MAPVIVLKWFYILIYMDIMAYALGGIHAANEASVIQAGAAGACRMSDYLKEI